MPSDETRKLLRAFGVVVTELEDAVMEKAPEEKRVRLEAQVRARLREIEELVDKLTGHKE